MTFCSKMHDRSRFVCAEQFLHFVAVADICMHKYMSRVVTQRSQIIQVASIGQLIDIHHRLIALRQPLEHKIRTDKTSAARH